MRRFMLGRAALAGVFTLALLASACSGNKPASNVAAGGPDASSAPAAVGASPGAKTSTTKSGRTGGVSPGGSAANGGGTVPSGKSVAGTKQKTSSGFTYKAANLFPPSKD